MLECPRSFIVRYQCTLKVTKTYLVYLDAACPPVFRCMYKHTMHSMQALHCEPVTCGPTLSLVQCNMTKRAVTQECCTMQADAGACRPRQCEHLHTSDVCRRWTNVHTCRHVYITDSA